MRNYIEYNGNTFLTDKIRAGNLYLATSLLASSLEVNSLYAEVEHDDPSILNFERNTQLLYYAEAGRPMVFRVQDIERTAPKLYRISATSTLGLLTEGLHYGGIYAGETLEEVVQDICGSVPVIIKTNLRKIKLYGWLPVAPPRDNLAQTLFAAGASLKTDLDGVLRIENLWDGLSGAVGEDKIYQEAGAAYSAAVTAVTVTEHQYIKGSEEKNLFDGATVEGDIITFSEPMHSLSASGFRILGQGANWARLSAGTGTLTGKVYVHNTREVTKAVSDAKDQNIKTVKDATLVSLVNSAAIANRLARYYRLRETINAPVVYRGELPGDRLSVFHPFDRVNTNSCLESADINLSNTLKAQEESLVGFVPEQSEEFGSYDGREVLTEGGYWEVPEGVASIRVVLIGGGQGGCSGTRGEDGKAGSAGGNGGTGGTGGEGGTGGNVFQAAVDVTPGERFEVIIGQGGGGGSYATIVNAPGKNGGNTLFGDLSSASGSPSVYGFIDPTTQEKFAMSGAKGADGGKGGNGRTSRPPDGATGMEGFGPSEEGEAVGGYQGGFGASSSAIAIWIGSSGPWRQPAWGGGGGGGGAAVATAGEDGDRGREGHNLKYSYVNNEIVDVEFTSGYAYGGKGGNGGSAVAPGKASVRGCGGDGGNGGGGGGGGGAANGAIAPGIAVPGSGGVGGSGSAGAAGAPGCIIIYYGVKKKKQSGWVRDSQGRLLLDRLDRRFVV